MEIKDSLESSLENSDGIQSCVLDLVRTTHYLVIFCFIQGTLFFSFGACLLIKLLALSTSAENRLSGVVFTSVFEICICIYIYPLIYLKKRSAELKRIVNNNCSTSYEDISDHSENVFKTFFIVILFAVLIFIYGLYIELPLI